jgi:hypothetical protein
MWPFARLENALFWGAGDLRSGAGQVNAARLWSEVAAQKRCRRAAVTFRRLARMCSRGWAVRT